MSDWVVVAGVLGMRLLVPLLILRYPLPGILAAIFADAIDGAIFHSFTSLSLESYQQYDKALDTYYLAIAYIAVLRNWVDPAAIRIGRFLWYYRLVGVALFAVLDVRILLFIFPATFEFFFIYYEAVRLRWNPLRISVRHMLTVAAVTWVFLKLPNEYWLHVAERSTTEWAKESIFGMDPSTPRIEVLAANLWAIPAALLIVALLVAAGALALRWLPPPDHATIVDANQHGPGGVQLVGLPRGVEPVFTAAMAEKVVLVALIGLIFASFLPGVEATALELTVALSIVVVLNAGIASWLGRRGREWRAATAEFGTMLFVNWALVLAIARIDRWTDLTLSAGSALFYALLLSLLITLYDRYRHQRVWWARGETAQSVSPAMTVSTPAAGSGH
jgi:hypothetical protein